jgi:hypothetical protein
MVSTPHSGTHKASTMKKKHTCKKIILKGVKKQAEGDVGGDPEGEAWHPWRPGGVSLSLQRKTLSDFKWMRRLLIMPKLGALDLQLALEDKNVSNLIII